MKRVDILLILGMIGIPIIPSAFSHFLGGVVVEKYFWGAIHSMPSWTILSLLALLLVKKDVQDRIMEIGKKFL